MLASDEVDTDVVIDGEGFGVRARANEVRADDGGAWSWDSEAVLIEEVGAGVERFDFVSELKPERVRHVRYLLSKKIYSLKVETVIDCTAIETYS